ncbi:MAG: thiopeptide-type bacteriocin biosynthesis protein [Oligoflexus sp.]
MECIEHVYLDGKIEALLELQLNKLASVRLAFPLVLTPTTVFREAKVTFSEKIKSKSNGFEYVHSEVSGSKELNAILAEFVIPHGWKDAVQKLTNGFGASPQDSEALLNELLDSGVMSVQLPNRTSALCWLAEVLAKANSPAQVELEPYIAILELLNRVAQSGRNAEIFASTCEDLSLALSQTLSIDLRNETVIQLDLIGRGPGGVSEKWLSGVTQQAEKLINLCAQENTVLQGFITKFRERFEDSPVPLLEAIDQEDGVQFMDTPPARSELLDGIRFSPGLQARSSTQPPDGRLAQALDTLVYPIDGASIDLAEVLSRSKNAQASSIPHVNSVTGKSLHLQVLVDSSGTVLATAVHSIAGATGVEMIGRFTTIDSQSCSVAANHLAQLDNEQRFHSGRRQVRAELHHVPAGRLLNVVRRSAELCADWISITDWHNEQRGSIRLSDLYLQLSGSKLSVFDKERCLEVLPSLTSVHNSHLKALPVYAFLASLAHESPVKIDLSGPRSWRILKHTPRVVFGDLIVKRATWTFSGQSLLLLKGLLADSCTSTFSFNGVAPSMPRYVTLDEGDNSLLIDLDSSAMRKMLLDEINQSKKISLAESLLSVVDSSVSLQATQLLEIVIPYTITDGAVDVRAEAYSRGDSKHPLEIDEIDKSWDPNTFILGDWRYWKIYCSSEQSDVLLFSVIMPMIERLLDAKLIDKWFFVRYNAPSYHVRLRYRVRSINEMLVDRSFGDILSSARAAGLIWRCEIAEYCREVYRYGGPSGIELAETVFQLDSELVVKCLVNNSSELESERYRLVGAIALVECYLSFVNDLSISDSDVLSRLNEGYTQTLISNKLEQATIGKKYRELRGLWDSLAMVSSPESEMVRSVTTEWRSQEKRRLALFDSLFRLPNKQSMRPGYQLQEMTCSLIHMLMNRWWVDSARLYEALVYEFMLRRRRSQAGDRTKSNT